MFEDIKANIDLDIYNRGAIVQIFEEPAEGLLEDSRSFNDCKEIKEFASNVSLSFHQLNDFNGNFSLFKKTALSEADKIHLLF